MRGWAGLRVVLLLVACGDAESNADTDGESGGSPAPPVSPSAEGWSSEYFDGGAVIGCDDARADLEASDAPRVEVDDAVIFVGYEQIGDNQNPIVARFDGDAQTWCVRHETEGPDGRALGITWDGGPDAYVVYSIVGGGSSLESSAGEGWLTAYAPGAISGGGPKVSYVGRVGIDDGALRSGTFIISVKSNNTVNSHNPSGAVVVRDDGNVEFRGSSAHKPIDLGQVAMDCTDYPFESRYVFPPNLSTPVCADCTNCASAQPCD